jgi:hypothetical protein
VPAAAGSLARRREARGNTQDYELLWGLGEVLGRPSGRRVEWKRSSSGRQAWRLGEARGDGQRGRTREADRGLK